MVKRHGAASKKINKCWGSCGNLAAATGWSGAAVCVCAVLLGCINKKATEHWNKTKSWTTKHLCTHSMRKIDHWMLHLSQVDLTHICSYTTFAQDNNCFAEENRPWQSLWWKIVGRRTRLVMVAQRAKSRSWKLHKRFWLKKYKFHVSPFGKEQLWCRPCKDNCKSTDPKWCLETQSAEPTWVLHQPWYPSYTSKLYTHQIAEDSDWGHAERAGDNTSTLPALPHLVPPCGGRKQIQISMPLPSFRWCAIIWFRSYYINTTTTSLDTSDQIRRWDLIFCSFKHFFFCVVSFHLDSKHRHVCLSKLC